MPIDHKRINGPEVTIPYQLYDKLNIRSLKQQFNEIVDPYGVRSDGRTAIEQRKIYLKTGVVSQAKGSAYIEVNNTKVIVSVFDPREIPNKSEYSVKGEIYCEFKFAPFSCQKRRLHQQDAEELQLSAIMKQALESVVFRHEFPNFQLDVYALVLHNDGGALSAAINAAGAALAEAAIPMYDILTSATVAVQGEHLLLDPTLDEETLSQTPIFQDEGKNEHGLIILSIFDTHQQVSQFFSNGFLEFETIQKGTDLLINASKDIVSIVKKCLVKHVVDSTENIQA